MMKTLLFLTLMTAGVMLQSCKKYPENVGVVSSTAKKRLVGAWEFESQSTALTSLKSDDDNYVFWRFDRDGQASMEFNFKDTIFRETYFPKDTTYVEVDTSGLDFYTWEFSDKKDNLILTNVLSSEEKIWRILKLTKNSLVFEPIGSTVRHEYRKFNNEF